MAFSERGLEEVLKTAFGEMIPFCGCVCVRTRAGAVRLSAKERRFLLSSALLSFWSFCLLGFCLLLRLLVSDFWSFHLLPFWLLGF